MTDWIRTPRYPKKRSRNKRFLTKHHIKNKTHGGNGDLWNIIRLRHDRHAIWHTLFHSLDLEGAIKLLQRVKRIKDRQMRNQLRVGKETYHDG